MIRFLSLILLSLKSICFSFAETYVVCIGISKYQNASALLMPENDAQTIAKIFKTKTKNVITMTGHYATCANIIKALSDQFSRAKEGDMIVFFFSGHGYYGGLCPYDIGPMNKNALSYEDIYAIFRKSEATKKVIFADACMSGGLRQEQSTSQSSPSSSSDVVFFLSSRTKEPSKENKKMKNGFFTAYLDRGLRGGADSNKDKLITAKELFTFVSNGVKLISKDEQHPVMWGSFDDDFVMMDWR